MGGNNGKVSPFRTIHNDVPIIGQAQSAEIHEARIMAVITCPCTPTAPMLLGNVDATATCKACGSVFAISSVDYSRENDMTMRIAIGRFTPLATPGKVE